jgi:DsbC/DsbD-like thiol-disulfide interchange protein
MIAFSLVACLMGGPVHAQPDVLRADLRAGWQTEGGGQMVAFHLTLQDGWKTYWRAPGDAGIPPHFDWSGSQNVKSVRFHWPRPEVFHVGGMQSIGYSHELVLPVEVVPIDPTKPVPRPGVADATIRRALGQRPSTAKEAGVTGVTCEVTPQKDGLRVTAVLTMPSTGGPEVVVLEPGLPGVWVSPADVTRNGGQLRAVVDMVGPTGGAFGLQRDAIVVTVLGKHRAVEVKGCAAP